MDGKSIYPFLYRTFIYQRLTWSWQKKSLVLLAQRWTSAQNLIFFILKWEIRVKHWCGLTERGKGDSIQCDQLPQGHRHFGQIDSENTTAVSHTLAEANTEVPTCCLPVKGGHGADSQQQVEQTLGGVRQAVILLQQVGQSGEVLAREHVHHHYVPRGEARQEAVTVQTHHPKSAISHIFIQNLTSTEGEGSFLSSMCDYTHLKPSCTLIETSLVVQRGGWMCWRSAMLSIWTLVFLQSEGWKRSAPKQSHLVKSVTPSVNDVLACYSLFFSTKSLANGWLWPWHGPGARCCGVGVGVSVMTSSSSMSNSSESCDSITLVLLKLESLRITFKC